MNNIDFLAQKVAEIRTQIERVFVGQDSVVEGVLIALIARGHVLLEGVPGLGKTLLVRALSSALHLEFRRIQFTPDLMPSDVTGNKVFDPKAGDLVLRQGPVFTQLLLADEINRAPAKTQSALLEAMQEGQVTIDGNGLHLPQPFIVLATQNPVESQGTYPLPEAQLDRFMFKLEIGYPQAAEEQRILQQHVDGFNPAALDDRTVNRVADAETILHLSRIAQAVHVDQRILAYITELVQKTRAWGSIYLGASPRAGVSLLHGSRVSAAMAGRDYVNADDVQRLANWCLQHRLVLKPEAEIEGLRIGDVLREIVAAVAVPDLR